MNHACKELFPRLIIRLFLGATFVMFQTTNIEMCYVLRLHGFYSRKDRLESAVVKRSMPPSPHFSDDEKSALLPKAKCPPYFCENAFSQN